MSLYIGLMSGTSLDGVDGVLADFDPHSLRPRQVLAHAHAPFAADLRRELLDLNSPGPDELHRAALAANALMVTYASVVERLLARSGRTAKEVKALGAHGQTVRHCPQSWGGPGYTWQLANGALLAECTRITTVCDFRSADLAAGGQGAPLVPGFHAACLAEPGIDVAVLNVGGIANLSLLAADGSVRGFDTGPGNVLMDLWCRRHFDCDYDHGGERAARGQVLPALLSSLLDEPYFSAAPPKSTGRDRFNAAWLDQRLSVRHGTEGEDLDVLATLCELTAITAATELRRHLPQARRLLVGGGGAFNRHLMTRLQARLPGVAVTSTAAAGVPPDQLEALAFAWLAACRLAGRSASLPAVTGARAARVLGALYAAPN
jgi:anhydro-N-acetylmuramic acid kinase